MITICFYQIWCLLKERIKSFPFVDINRSLDDLFQNEPRDIWDNKVRTHIAHSWIYTSKASHNKCVVFTARPWSLWGAWGRISRAHPVRVFRCTLRPSRHRRKCSKWGSRSPGMGNNNVCWVKATLNKDQDLLHFWRLGR